jgi:hypothetical protein
MKSSKRKSPPGETGIPPLERYPVGIRAYVRYSEKRGRASHPRHGSYRPEWMLVFDTETTTDFAQRLRFGAYEVWHLDVRKERGLFYDPTAVSGSEKQALQRFARTEGFEVRTAEDFVEAVFYRIGYFRRGMIVGFNLPFDISRLAIGHAAARGVQDAFTFMLSRNRYRPRIQIAHQSQRAAFTRYTAAAGQRDSRSERKRAHRSAPWRGAFVDVKTIGAALTGSSHSLESLATLLGTTRKQRYAKHGSPIDRDQIRYCVQDVNATRECFFKLRTQYDDHGLIATPINRIYSEASIGKAEFKEMNIRQSDESDLPDWLIGIILSSYYGGRSEVHWRRTIKTGLYCDFHSMYPTMFTNMGLWPFVIANGVIWRDSTVETRVLLSSFTLVDLRKREFWAQLTTLVQVQPNADIFPVRAQYDADGQYTIGLNYLTSQVSLWYTLPDCINSALRTGKLPQIIRAVTFEPKGVQPDLRPVSIMGNDEYRVDPKVDNFPKRLIELRTITKKKMESADEKEKARLDSDQLALKILANATTYGIFVELNPEDLGEVKTLQCLGSDDDGFAIQSRTFERPGRYFKPLLATLITGGARLMLGIAETLIADQGLDWILCDTDSMIIGKPDGMPDDQFQRRAKRVRDWFQPLSPYDVPVELFKLEEENFAIGDKQTLQMPCCYAVSAKRYLIFNIDENDEPVVRRASGHGLGALRKPYGDGPDEGDLPKPPRAFPKPRAKLKGVARWQHDYWHGVAKLALEGRDNDANAADHPIFDQPAASSYHATTPAILSWFDRFNKGKPYQEQVRPFGFLLAFQPDPLYELTSKSPKGAKPFRPIAPYDKNIAKALPHCFDRNNPEADTPISRYELRTYRQVLANYHMHPESKFRNAGRTDRGPTVRRHIYVEPADIHYIGKESNDWEEQLYLGIDDCAQQEYGQVPEAVAQFMQEVRTADHRHGRRQLARAANMSARYLSAIISGAAKNPSPRKLAKLKRGMARLEAASREYKAAEQEAVLWLCEQCTHHSIGEVAKQLDYDPKNLDKVRKGVRPPSGSLLEAIKRVRACQTRGAL